MLPRGVPTPQFGIVNPHRSQAHSRLSLLHWAHRRLLHPQFAMVVLLRPTACSTPASQFSMVAPHRSQAHSRCSLLHWAHRRLLQPPAAPPLSPSLDFRFACSRHWRRRSSVPTGLTSRCFAHSARASCAPLSPRGAFWIVVLPYEATLPKSLLFPEGKREVARRSRDGGIQKGGVTAQP